MEITRKEIRGLALKIRDDFLGVRKGGKRTIIKSKVLILEEYEILRKKIIGHSRYYELNGMIIDILSVPYENSRGEKLF